MNKLLKTSLAALSGIIFFGLNYVTTPVAHATNIELFSVSPTTVTSGESVTFTWVSDSPDNLCILTGGNIPNPPGRRGQASGSDIFQVTTANTPAQGPQSIRFNIECTGKYTDNEAVYVVVNPASGTKPVVAINATPTQIAADGSTPNIVINWSATNTKAPNGCVASGPGEWSGPREFSGSWTITPAQTGTYSLTCSNPNDEVGTGSVVVSQASIGEEGASLAPGSSKPKTDLSQLSCFSIKNGMNVGGCVALYLYYVVYIPTSWLLYGAGWVFDTALTLSIDKNFVIQPFIEKLWTILRNFSNMIFIFILLYTGIQTMLGMGDWKKTVLRVVVIALLINFSLFFTKVVIDAGNVLAVGVYSSLGAEKPISTTKNGTVKERDISAALVSGFQPQAFIGATAVSQPLDAIVIFLIASAISGFTAYIFFKAALLFLGRLLAFWYLMIISPFAFTSVILPKGNIFNDWTNLLLNQAFVAPVYLFFIYLILQVVDSGLLTGMMNTEATTVSGFFFDKLIIPIILAAMVLMALQKTLKSAEKMAGEFGSAASKFVGSAISTVAQVGLAAATGGTALAVGKLGAAAAASGALTNAAAGSGIKGKFARLGLLAADKAQTATFDPRNIGGGIGKGLTGLGLGRGNKINYENQSKNWRENDWKGDNKEKEALRMARLMEVPGKVIEKGEKAVASVQAEINDLDRLVRLAEEEAKNSKPGKALEDAKKNEEKLRKEMADAEKERAETNRELARLQLEPASDKRTKTEDELNKKIVLLTNNAGSKMTAYASAASTSASMESAFTNSSEGKKMKEKKTLYETQKKDFEAQKEIKEKDLEEMRKEVGKENEKRRNEYADHHQDSSDGSKDSRNRAKKIRDAGTKEYKDKEKSMGDTDKLLKDLAKLLETNKTT